MKKPRVLLVYTGGTIGMIQDSATSALKPFDFNNLVDQVPELDKISCEISYLSFGDPLDSSNIQPDHWLGLAALIKDNYFKYDGFVILHGSDTMAYTASALSFIFENLAKPVILTGSQLPIGEIRTDAKENLITAIEIASSGNNQIKEVAIYFDYHLLRGNRSRKNHSEKFRAFDSPNFPPLAEAGVHIRYNNATEIDSTAKPNELIIAEKLDQNIAILKFFPGITSFVLEAIVNIQGLRAIVLETFGAGNLPTMPWVFDLLSKANDKGIILVNITQCHGGSVEPGRYETSSHLVAAGVISGKDITTESAVTKLSYLLGKYQNIEEVKEKLTINLRGEIS